MARKPKKAQREALDHQQECPTDPVFCPNLAKIEELTRKAPPERLNEGALDYHEIFETICGVTDDSQPVEHYDGALGVTRAFVDAHERPVGVLRWNSNLAAIYDNPGNVAGQRWCTGTLISENLFLTAGHCFDQTGGGWARPRVNGAGNIIPPEEIALNMSVEFGFQHDPSGNVRTPTSVAVEDLVEYRLGGIDFAIVRLAGSPGATWGVARIASVDANVGDMLCIIGHPAGQPKRIEAGPLTSFDGDRVRYNDIDTLGGNSGSGILRAADGCIVGVHTNGGCNAAMTGSNFGVRISALRRESPTLRGLVAHTNPRLDRLVTHVAADVRVTLARSDYATSALADRFTGILADRATGFVADRTTSPLLDQGTSPIADQRGTPGKALDDVKAGGLDKQFSDRGAPGPGGRFDPVAAGPAAGGGALPFALATPHHAPQAAGLPAAEEAEAYEAELTRIATVIEALAEQIDRLQAEHEALAAEYAARRGG